MKTLADIIIFLFLLVTFIFVLITTGSWVLGVVTSAFVSLVGGVTYNMIAKRKKWPQFTLAELARNVVDAFLFRW